MARDITGDTCQGREFYLGRQEKSFPTNPKSDRQKCINNYTWSSLLIVDSYFEAARTPT